MQKTDTVLLRGGLNIVTPAIAVPAGMAIAAENYVCDVRGYTRVSGYERYDGRDRPSAASYWVLDFDAGLAAITTGQTVTGLTSGATGIALQDAVVSTGSYGGSDAAGYLILGTVVGTFQDNEALRVGGVNKSTANGLAEEQGASTQALDQAWTKLAADAKRALIAEVPGSGPVRGVGVLNGSLYAVRDNAGATAGVLHKATTGGWVAQSLGSYLKFDAASAAFTEGTVVTGGTSGATATVRRVVLIENNWGGTGVGLLVLSGITGTFQNNEAITGGGGAAVVDGTLVANALPAGGHYDFTGHNFYGPGFTARLYGCNGVGRGFEWDGTYFTPIFTGLSDALDKPTRIAQFSNHLFLFYDGGLVQFSEIGVPTAFKTSGGAGDMAFGHDFTDVLEASSTSMILLGTNKIGFVTGTDVDNFVLQIINEEAGAFAWTAQAVGQPVYLDDAGIRRLSTTDAFGDWRMGTISQAIEPLLARNRRNFITPTASVRIRSRDQYLVFFSDMTAVSVYFGRETPECMPLRFEHQPFCAGTGEITGDSGDGVFFGADDGYVYEMERGRSFDGEVITAFIRFAFNSIGSPSQNKRFHQIIIECDVSTGVDLSISCDFAYGNPDYSPSAEAFSIAAGGGFWDSASWNEFYWSQQAVGQASAFIDGFGQNISPSIASVEIDDEDPHTLSSMTVFYSYRGLRRAG